MATYPLVGSPSFSYKDHLMYNEYISDINKGIQRVATESTSKLSYGQMASTKIISDTITENTTYLAKTISSELSGISSNIENLTDTVQFGLEEVSFGINGLRADFDIAMGKVMLQFEMLRSEMKAGFEHIINILENRRKTEAQEHFRDAISFYKDGCRFPDKPQWFKDALRHFMESVNGYERNPLAHLHIGHIYHYQKDQMNFEKALKHYQLCYTYGEADKNDYCVAAQGYFYAGWLNAVVLQNLNEAIKLTNTALEFDENLAEAHYHLAKFYSLSNQKDSAIHHLRKAIVSFDRDYCIKAGFDSDFNPIRDDVNQLFKNLKNESLTLLKDTLKQIDRNFDPIDDEWVEDLYNIYSKYNLEEMPEEDTYFAYLDDMPKANEMLDRFHQAKQDRESNYDLARRNLKEMENIVSSMICVNPSKIKEIKEEIDEMKELLNNRSHISHKRAITIAEQSKIKTYFRFTPDEYNRKIENGLCLICDKKIGFFQRTLFKEKYCNTHSFDTPDRF